MKTPFILVAGSVVLMAACETTSSRPYTVSTQNVMAFQSALESDKVQIGEFTTAPDVSDNMTCRAMGALEVAPGKTPVEFIEGAFRDELFAAGAIADGGPVISGEITELDFNSFGTGSWDISIKLLSSSFPAGYVVSESYFFKTSFSAYSACQNVIDAFTPAVQKLISAAIADPNFKALADRK